MKSARKAIEAVELVAGTADVVTTPLVPYSEEAIVFLSELSSVLLKTQGVRSVSDVVAFAFWCRHAHLLDLQQAFHTNDDLIRFGRGLAFHIAPSNVPVNFAFSYVFSLLAGNANIVRVPSRDFLQVRMICKAIDEVLLHHEEIRCRSAFVRYPVDDSITEAFVACADVRLIWGGDSTVAHIRSMETKPRSIEVVFADRYSIAVFDGKELSKIRGKELESLAEGFYNDTYLMDQNACSSPQLIFWINANEEDKQHFWSAVIDYAAARYELQAAISVDKYVKLSCDVCAERVVGYKNDKTGILYRVTLSDKVTHLDECRGVGGYFYECDIASFEDIVPVINEKYQTIIYYGISPSGIAQALFQGHSKGVDRIVPVGKAMDIGLMWDGYDLISTLSRVIELR